VSLDSLPNSGWHDICAFEVHAVRLCRWGGLRCVGGAEKRQLFSRCQAKSHELSIQADQTSQLVRRGKRTKMVNYSCP
jgi:hypothetical protein